MTLLLKIRKVNDAKHRTVTRMRNSKNPRERIRYENALKTLMGFSEKLNRELIRRRRNPYAQRMTNIMIPRARR